MMFTNTTAVSSRTIVTIVLSLLCLASYTLAGDFCNVCRQPPYGTREIANPSKSFKLSNGKTFTCGFMQRSMADVRVAGPYSTQSEKAWCKTAQYIVEQNCKCNGTPMKPIASEYVDPNPACRLCVASGLDNKKVPNVNYDKLTNTGAYGNMNCRGLEMALNQGVFPPSACGTIQQKSARTCCNFAF